MAEKIRVYFLGTGSAVPTARRNHSAYFLKFKSESILMDCGEGTQRQFRRAKLSFAKINKILITHWHGDHSLGLPGLFQSLVLGGFKGKILVYGPRGTKRKFKEMVDFHLNFYFRAISPIQFEVKEVGDGNFFENEDFVLSSIEVEHPVPTVSYSFVLKEKNRIDKEKLLKLDLPNSPLIRELSLGKKVKIGGRIIDGKKLIYKEPSKKICYITDTRRISKLDSFVKGADLLICDSSFMGSEGELAKNYFHMTNVESANLALKNKVGKLAMTHLSQRHDESPKKVEKEARKIFPNAFVPEDLDFIDV